MALSTGLDLRPIVAVGLQCRRNFPVCLLVQAAQAPRADQRVVFLLFDTEIEPNVGFENHIQSFDFHDDRGLGVDIEGKAAG